jgi:hypothetical protein
VYFAIASFREFLVTPSYNEEHGIGPHGGEECTQGFSGEIEGKNIPLEVLGVVGRIILKQMLGWEDMNWIHLPYIIK